MARQHEETTRKDLKGLGRTRLITRRMFFVLKLFLQFLYIYIYRMRLLELLSGTKSFGTIGSIAEQLRYEIVSMD